MGTVSSRKEYGEAQQGNEGVSLALYDAEEESFEEDAVADGYCRKNCQDLLKSVLPEEVS